MFCIKCGKELPDDAMFCFSCGERVNRDIVSSNPTTDNAYTSESESDYDDYRDVPVSSMNDSDYSDYRDEQVSSTNDSDSENATIPVSELMAKLGELENAMEIYDYVSEHTNNNDELLKQLQTIKEIEKNYGNKKQQALSKVNDYYSSKDHIGFNPSEQQEEHTGQNQGEPPEINEDTKSEWYIMAGNERKGPISKEQIKSLVKKGVFKPDNLVWKSGFNGWLKAGDTELRDIVYSIAPDAPPAAVSDKWLWALATVPLICEFILSIYFPNMSLMITGVVVVLNIVFLALDIKELEKSRYSPDAWLWLGFVLVPIYLFVRASKTTKNKAPGIVWCVLFLISLI